LASRIFFCPFYLFIHSKTTYLPLKILKKIIRLISRDFVFVFFILVFFLLYLIDSWQVGILINIKYYLKTKSNYARAMQALTSGRCPHFLGSVWSISQWLNVVFRDSVGNVLMSSTWWSDVCALWHSGWVSINFFFSPLSFLCPCLRFHACPFIN
jgi:hypothetical protein